MDLESLRNKIDTIDTKIVDLLNQRARVAADIGNLKKDKGTEYFDPSRQKKVIQKVLNLNISQGGLFPNKGLEAVYREIMSACLNLEEGIKIAYLGPPSTYTHIAALKEFGNSVVYIPYETISDIFLAVEKKWVTYGIVPIENSTEGIISYTLDMFMDSDLKICSEIMLDIHHCLLSNCKTIPEIKKIFSGRQPFAQCKVFIKENLPNAELIEVAATTKGVELALNTKDSAAIASELAAETYNIEILVKDIEDIKDNRTRFLVISEKYSPKSGKDKTSLMFSIKDEPGALYKMLHPFAQASINLTKIESRPTRRKAWEYIFFVDMEGHIEDKNIKSAIQSLERKCIFLKHLGSYPSSN